MVEHSVDIIIIGAGAAGLMAAAAAGKACKVIVLEKMPRPGRKIMITGKGRCNFTNVKAWNDFSGHIHPKPGFLKHAFYNLTPEKTIAFMEENGMECVVERGERAFPASQKSSDVVDTLVKAATTSGAEILCNKEVTGISHTEENTFRTECADGSIYISSCLIICTGGLSYPKTGSTGDGYRLAGDLGHKTGNLLPSLTAIVPKGYKTEGKGHISRETPLSETGEALNGIHLKNVSLTVTIDANQAQCEFGDLDFTDGGLEGPLGFKVSRKCVTAIANGSKADISIDLKPAVDPEDLQKRISGIWKEIESDRRFSARAYKERFRELISRLLPGNMVSAFIRTNPGMDHRSLARHLKDWKMPLEGYVGYERCVITNGGIRLDEIVPKTMESRLIKGLYFAGEVLDLDADTGGYNLQTAFSTGRLAGESAANQVKQSHCYIQA